MTARPSEATQQAAQWVVQLRSPESPPDAEQEFADWLRASPLHVREYLRAVEIWEGLGYAATHAQQSVEELLREAAGAELIPLPGTTLAGLPATPPRLRVAAGDRCAVPRLRVGLLRALVAVGLCVVVCFTYLGWKYFTVLDVANGVGEQRSAVLPDRSIVELNTQSEIRVAFTATERRVELVRGEAFFNVSKDPARPFIVATDLATAKAVGTHFSVYRTPTGTIVTVSEGRVLVRDTQAVAGSSARPAPSADAVEVRPGSLAEARPGRPVQMRPADVERALAWRQRRLIFEGESLIHVVEEFNRYNSLPLVIVDPRLREQRISGVFAANDPESLLDFLSKVDHISVTRLDGRAVRIGDSERTGDGEP
jgi:transmembrane sensor